MAKEEKGYWFSTENGTHIHAEEGENKEQAMSKKFKSFGKGKAKKDTTFEEINEKRINGKSKKHDYSEIFDEDYQRSWGVPDFKDENDVKTLNDIVEKAMEYDGDEGAIDISNNAMERIEELVKFSPEEQDKLATGTGEEIMDILRGKEKKELTFEGAVKNADDDVLDEQFGKDTPERKLVGAMKGQETKPAFDSVSSKQLTEEEIETKLKEVHSKLDPLEKEDNILFNKSLRTGEKYENKNKDEISKLSKESQSLRKQRDELRKNKAINHAKELGRKDYSDAFKDFYNDKGEFSKISGEDRIYAVYQYLETNPYLDENSVFQREFTENRSKYPNELEFKDDKFVISKSGNSYDHFKKKDGNWEHISVGTIYGLGMDLKNKLGKENLVKGK